MKRSLLGCLLAFGLNASGWSLPTDPTTVHGQVQIQNGQNLVQILQQTPQAIINWGQFNIGLGETVRFLQPGPQSAILNRVTGLDPSLIQGMLQANGRVFLLNPNGVLFGPNAVVDVGSFTASTLKMSDEDFLNGSYKLTQDRALPLAALTNQGTIKVAEGGFVVLVSPLLDNQGLILAQAGQVHLGASTQATFSVDGRGLVQFVVPDGFDPQFRGGGQGGNVLLQPGQMSQLLSQVVTNPLLVEAGSFESGSNGQTLARGAEGVLLNSGSIQAPGGLVRLDSSQASILPASGQLQGGEVRLLSAGQTVSSGQIKADFAEVSGKKLWAQGPIQANHILFDPFDITITDAGGGTFDPQLPNPTSGGSGSVSVAAMQAQSGTVTLNADHDVIYNGAGFNLNATALTVVAGNDINLTSNGQITASTLNLQAGRDVLLTVNGTGGLTSSSGALTVVGARDVRLSATADLILSSPTLAQLTATSNDLVLTSAVVNSNFTTFLNGGGAYQLSAGHDLTLTQPSLQAGSSSLSTVAGNDVILQQGNGGFLTVNAGSFSSQAGRNFVAGPTSGNFGLATSSGGNIQITAVGQARVSSPGALNLSSGGSLVLRAASVNVTTAGTTLSANGQTVVNATGGNLSLVTSSNDLTVSSATNRTAINATGDVDLRSGSDIKLSSATTTRVDAGNDVKLTSSLVNNNFTTFLTGPDTAIRAGHDLDMRQPNLRHATGTGAVVLTAGNDLRFTSPNNQVAVDLGSLQAQAGRDLSGTPAVNSLTMRASTGNLDLSAGRNLTLNAPGTLSLNSDLGFSHVTARDIQLSGGSLTVGAKGEAVVNATSGNLSLSAANNNVNVGSANDRTAINATGDVKLVAGADIILSSATTTRVDAGNDANLTSSNVNSNFTTFLTGPDTAIRAGHDLDMRQPNLRHSTGTGSVLLTAVNDLRLTSPNNQVTVDLGALQAQAGRDLSGAPAANGLSIRASVGNLELSAGRNLTLSAPGTFSLNSVLGVTHVTARDIQLSGGSLGVGAKGETVVNATSGNLSLRAASGDVNVSSATDRTAINATGDVDLRSGSDIKLSSATTTRVDAGNDASLTSSLVNNNFTTFLTGPDTAIRAGHDLDMRQPNLRHSTGTGAVVLTAGNDLRFTSPNNQLIVDLGSLQAQAGRDLSAVPNVNSLSMRASTGNLDLSAGRNLTLNAPSTLGLTSDLGASHLSAQDIQVSGSAVSVVSKGETVLNATNGNLTIAASPSDLVLRSTTDRVAVNTTNGDVNLSAGGDIKLESATTTAVNSTRDINLSSALVLTNFTTFLTSPSTSMAAGRNLTLSQPNLIQTGGSTVLKAGNDLTVRNDVAGLNANLQSVDAQAGGNLRIQANNGFSFRTSQGLKLAATGNLSFGPGTLQNSSGATSLSGGNVILNNIALNTGPGDVNLQSSGNLTVGTLNSDTGSNISLSGSNITIQSMQQIQGGNYTITTPGNLTEVTPATNPTNLAALNITAGNAFGLSASNSSFSIPNTAPGNLTGLVTGGNDTVLHASSSFRNFNGANFQPGHIDHQTGDIFVDGQLFYSGLPPITPPPNPPSPPPTPQPTLVPLAPVVSQEAPSTITPEQRTQILAQSNLALGNLGGFSRVLSETEQQHLTARQDSLHQTWPLDPFSPTLALTVPGGPPQVYASELASLEALLLSNVNQNDYEEKTRGAYNVIVDQELREIWEIRYWRHLLEGFIIWEDRE
ncbi:filamentous hemagglutinin N-terminal domain-containing protein [bacterium]|nr:filamentous hemagglutinin N-terminal domain-containing protein [bacterium]